MANRILTKIRNDDDAPPVDLMEGELAVNLVTRKLFVGPVGSTVGVPLTGGGDLGDGLAEGNTLRWDATAGQWVANDTLVVTDAGNVGVGTDAPALPLGIQGQMVVGTDVESAGKDQGTINLTFPTADNTTFQGINFVSSNAAGRCFINYRSENSSTVGRLILGTSNTERMTINGSGNVAINSPDTVFDGATHRFAVTSTGNVGGFYRESATAANGLVNFFSDLGGTETLVAQVRVDGTYLGPISDGTLKDNIRDSQDGLGAINNIEVVAFDWKEGAEKVHNGFVAQQLQSVLPQAVSESSGGLLARVDAHILPVVVKALQELTGRLEALEGA